MIVTIMLPSIPSRKKIRRLPSIAPPGVYEWPLLSRRRGGRPAHPPAGNYMLARPNDLRQVQSGIRGRFQVQCGYMNHSFTRRLSLGPLLGDGAMGTILLARGVPLAHPFDELNLTDPRLIGGIHREYISAGAELIETNTFGANRVRLAPHGLDQR